MLLRSSRGKRVELARAGMGFQWVGAQVVSVLTQLHHGTTPEDIALGRLEEAGACLAAACLSKTLYPSCSLEVGNGWEPGDLKSSPRTVPPWWGDPSLYPIPCTFHLIRRWDLRCQTQPLQLPDSWKLCFAITKGILEGRATHSLGAPGGCLPPPWLSSLFEAPHPHSLVAFP